MDSTIGASFSCVERAIENHVMKLHVWDTAGQERYRGIINIYYRGVDFGVIACDLTDNVSINSIEYWIKDFRDRTNNPDAKIIIVGNKVDLVKEINNKINIKDADKEDIDIININKNGFQNQILEEIRAKYNIRVIYASALNGENLNEIFDYIIRNYNLLYHLM